MYFISFHCVSFNCIFHSTKKVGLRLRECWCLIAKCNITIASRSNANVDAKPLEIVGTRLKHCGATRLWHCVAQIRLCKSLATRAMALFEFFQRRKESIARVRIAVRTAPNVLMRIGTTISQAPRTKTSTTTTSSTFQSKAALGGI